MMKYFKIFILFLFIQSCALGDKDAIYADDQKNTEDDYTYNQEGDTYSAEINVTVSDISGSYAQKYVTTVNADIPIIGLTRVQNTAYQLVTISQNEEQLTIDSQLCHLFEDSESSMVSTNYPTAFISAIDDTIRPATIEVTDAGLLLKAPMHYELRAVHLKNPESDPLPQPSQPTEFQCPNNQKPDASHTDNCHYDQDKDGKPGLTVEIDGIVSGDVYVFQRTWSSYEGIIHDTETFQVNITWGDEQVIIDATKNMLKDPLDRYPTNGSNDNYALFIRVPDNTNCDYIVEHASNLFD